MTQGLELRAFLRERRARLSPQSFGLPARSSRRKGGLCREDVAELLEVTPLWYALFESGTSGRRFSALFIERLGNIFQLDEADRDTLVRLVVATGHAACDLENEWQRRRLRALVTDVAAVAAQLAAHSADAERTVESAQYALQRIIAAASSVDSARTRAS
jgi:hypothetical protein